MGKQILSTCRFKTLLVMWFFTTYFWINPGQRISPVGKLSFKRIA